MRRILATGLCFLSFTANAGLIEKSYEKFKGKSPTIQFVSLVASEVSRYPMSQRTPKLVDEIVNSLLKHEEKLKHGITVPLEELDTIKKSPQFKRASLIGDE